MQLRNPSSILIGIVALIALSCGSQLADAAGDEYSLRGDDLVVTVSTKWAGCSNGGYYPIRLLVQNKGVDCTLTCTFAGQMEGVAAATRTVAVAQNATVKFTLPVPCVGTGTYGDLKIYRNGRLVKGMERSVSIPDALMGGTPRPAFLVISPTDVDFDPLESAVTSRLPEALGGGGGGYSGYGYGGYYGVATENHERVEATMLPDEWIAYSGLDFVAIPLATLAKITASERAAILNWVHTGGSLIVYQVGDEATQSQQLTDLLNLNQHDAVSDAWKQADDSTRTFINIIDMDDYGNVVTSVVETEDGEIVEKAIEPPVGEFVWSNDAGTFASRDLMLGQVHAFRDNPFPGSPHDWNWFLSSLPSTAKNWVQRNGISARYGTTEFLNFLIPSVRGVPVFAFLLLITLFTVVIGPLNYMFLWRRRRLYLLVLTIPLIALGTSLALFGYSAIAHGFATKSRARTLTYVDQQAKTSVTLGRFALYAGLAPSDGLRFSSDTSVMPIWPEDHEFVSARTDWTDQQNLRNGWLKSRTRTQFLTTGHRDERGRLDVTASGDGLRVTNGFESEFRALVVSDVEGNHFYGNNIPAGASADLVPMTAEQRQEFTKLLDEYPLRPPDLNGETTGWFNWNIGYYGYNEGPTASFNTGLLESKLARIHAPNQRANSVPQSAYAAVLAENPGVELGVESTKPQASLHVLMGEY